MSLRRAQYSRKNKGTGRARGTKQPPPIPQTLSIFKRLRFVAGVNNPGGYSITSTDLLDLYCMATATTTAYQIFNAVRVVSVEVWAPGALDTASSAPVINTCFIEYPALVAATGLGGRSVRMVDTSTSLDEPAHVRAAPPEESYAAMWAFNTSIAGTNVMFNIGGPISGFVVDVTLELTIRDSALAPQTVTGSVSGATVGQVYVRALDSTSVGSLVPVSVNTV